MIQIFRILIVISTLSYAVFVFLPYLDESFLTQQEIDVLTWSKYEALIIFPDWLSWFLIYIWLPLAIGMWFFNRLARTAYLCLSIFFLVFSAFSGLFVSTGLEIMLYQATAFLDGAIITMAYLTNLNDEFKKA